MRAVRAGICVLTAFAVLALGGVEPWGKAILELGAACLFLLWGILALRRREVELGWNWLYLPLAGLVALGLVQYAFGVSVYPYLTKVELLKWWACVLLFFLSVESFRTTAQAKRLVWFLILLGFLISVFGIVQHFSFNGKLYWLVRLPRGAGPFGPYVNRDDFAGLVELTAPLGLALLWFRAWRREQLVLLGLFTIVPIGALALSGSRGGIIGFLFAAGLVLLFSRARRMGKRQVVAATALGLLAGAFVLWLGVSQTVARFEQLRPSEISSARRVSLYRDTWHIFLHYPWAGTGLGTLVAVYPKYESYDNGLVVEHAHNDYLELLADAGVAGGLCGLAFLVLLFWRGLTNLRAAERRSARAIYAGSLAACAGLLVHSLVDFNLQIPANALIFLVLASLASSGWSDSGNAGLRAGKPIEGSSLR